MSYTLPPGTEVGGLQIIELIGEGGFGIVYLAFDPTLQRQVALKEYMPSSLASRALNSTEVVVRSQRFIDAFNAGLRSFVNEARLLAHFDHPALVKVHQFWQTNRTAYMVMPYYKGPTLKSHVLSLVAQDQTLDEATLRHWLAPLLDALELMHAEQCYHRDIAPDNILLTAKGPLLLDFGAARRVISDMTHALTVILKPGYAPIEQYGDVATMTQGPWTDLYALASVMYFCITGHSPITSVERMMGDPLPRLTSVAADRYSEHFLNALDSALAVRPLDRPQSIAEFRALLDAKVKPLTEAATKIITDPFLTSETVPSQSPTAADLGGRWWRSVAVKATVGVLAVAIGVGLMSHHLGNPWESGDNATSASDAIPVPDVTTVTSAELQPAVVLPPVPKSKPIISPPASTLSRTTTSTPTPNVMVTTPVTPRLSAAPKLSSEPTLEPVTPPATSEPSQTSTSEITNRSPDCDELLMKGSQQPLSLDEANFLRAEC